MEIEQTQQPRHELPEQIADCFQSDAAICQLATSHDSSPIRAQLAEHYYDASEETVMSDMGSIIRWCAHRNNEGDQNYRDAAIAVTETIMTSAAPRIDTSATLRKSIVQQYADTVASMDGALDYYTSPLSMYELGESIARGLGDNHSQMEAYETHMQIRAAWSAFFTKHTDTETKELGKSLTETLVPKFYAAVEVADERTWDYARSKPDFHSPVATELHDAYMDAVQQKGTFKPVAWHGSSAYRQYAKEKGIDLADFWNLSTTESIPSALEAVCSDVRLAPIIPAIERAVSANCGVTLEELRADSELARALADEINSAIKQVRMTNVIPRTHDATNLLSRLTQQVDEAVAARKPRRKLDPVNKFLESADLERQRSARDAVLYIREPQIVEAINHFIATQNENYYQIDQLLSDYFPEHPYTNLSFMRRDSEDMFSADETVDCTSYHLENGFNAWTLPYWMANPGFVMSYITMGNKKIAKMGMLLAEDDQNRPRLVVDSIETYKNLKDEQRQPAINAIYLALNRLQAWADERELGDVIFCTLTNSSELAVELPVTENPNPPQTLRPLGGEAGLDEVYASLSAQGAKKVDTIGYLQSIHHQNRIAQAVENAGVLLENVDRNNADSWEAEAAIVRLESLIATTRDENVFAAARRGNVGELIVAYAKSRAPLVPQFFGEDGEFYHAVLDCFGDGWVVDKLIRQQSGEVTIVDSVTRGVLHTKRAVEEFESGRRDLEQDHNGARLLDRIAVRDISVLEQKYDKLRIHAQAVDALLKELDAIARAISIRTALSQIFGEGYEGNGHADNGAPQTRRNARLKTGLSIIDRSFYAL